MGETLPLGAMIRQCRCGRRSLIAGSFPITFILVGGFGCVPSPGRPMGSASLLEAMIRPYKFGRLLAEPKSSPIMVTPDVQTQPCGHLMVITSPPAPRMDQCRYGMPLPDSISSPIAAILLR